MIAEGEGAPENSGDADDEMKKKDEEENKEGADTMTLEEAMSAIAQKDQTIAELENKVSAAEKTANDLTQEKDAAVEQAVTDKENAKAELETANNTIAEKDTKIAELESKIAELEVVKAEFETMKAEKEAAALAEKQEKAKSFAKRQGLDVESDEVKNAIASLNYEAIASMAMEIKPDENPKVTLAGYSMTQGIELNDKYSDLLKTR